MYKYTWYFFGVPVDGASKRGVIEENAAVRMDCVGRVTVREGTSEVSGPVSSD